MYMDGGVVEFTELKVWVWECYFFYAIKLEVPRGNPYFFYWRGGVFLDFCFFFIVKEGFFFNLSIKIERDT